ncbi:MAG: hypothetical protein ISR65_18065 [Bacteriovoracaceae bacterium]|nr:hypothetical protein [Bacteriovoracaceae bacterium]
MKLIIFATFSILTITAPYASDSKYFMVEGLEDERDFARSQIISDSESTQIFLDCQSFLTGVNFYNVSQNTKEQVGFFYLYEDECYDFHHFIKKSLDNSKSTCIEVIGNYENMKVYNKQLN